VHALSKALLVIQHRLATKRISFLIPNLFQTRSEQPRSNTGDEQTTIELVGL
jgi:hypothetical protein